MSILLNKSVKHGCLAMHLHSSNFQHETPAISIKISTKTIVFIIIDSMSLSNDGFFTYAIFDGTKDNGLNK